MTFSVLEKLLLSFQVFSLGFFYRPLSLSLSLLYLILYYLSSFYFVLCYSVHIVFFTTVSHFVIIFLYLLYSFFLAIRFTMA